MPGVVGVNEVVEGRQDPACLEEVLAEVFIEGCALKFGRGGARWVLGSLLDDAAGSVDERNECVRAGNPRE